MIAVTYQRYGSPEVLRLERIERPQPASLGDDQVLVRVMAAAVNPLDWHAMRGTPYFLRLMSGGKRPNERRLGADLAGVVEAVGEKVTRFAPGDEVFGAGKGAFAEYAVAREDRLAARPGNLTFVEAAAVPVAASTALQGLRDLGGLAADGKVPAVLVNGASGGVGSFALQIAKALGARVTGVCGTWNVDLVRSLGADEVIDYTENDFASGGRRYHLMLDCAGNRSPGDCRRALVRGGRYVAVAGPSGRWIAPLPRLARLALTSPFVSQKQRFFIASVNAADLETLKTMIEEGKIKPAVERVYELDQVPAAIRHLESGHARGKTVIRIGDRS